MQTFCAKVKLVTFFSILISLKESHSDELLLPLVEKLKQEKDKLSTLVESYTTHYKTSNTKPTKWEATLSEALKESNQMMQSVGSRVDQLRQESVNLSSKPPLPFTTSISQIRYIIFLDCTCTDD
jgi:hypothetical protein